MRLCRAENLEKFVLVRDTSRVLLILFGFKEPLELLTLTDLPDGDLSLHLTQAKLNLVIARLGLQPSSAREIPLRT